MVLQVEPQTKISGWVDTEETHSNLCLGGRTQAVIHPYNAVWGIMCYYTSEKTNIFYTSNNVVTCMREQRRVSSETNTRDQGR